MTARSIVTLAVVTAFVAAGCGGDGGGEDEPTGRPVPSKAEFVRKANAGCEAAKKGLSKEMADFLKQGKAAGAPRWKLYSNLIHFVLLPRVELQMEAIRALKEPRGDEERINEAVFAEQIALDNLANTKRISSIEAVERAFIESGRMLRAYGLSAYANDPQSGAGSSFTG